jgi:hypothetical protein
MTMKLIRNTSQQDDPNGLNAIADLIQHGKDEDFDNRVSERLPEIRRVRELLDRVRTVTPGVEFSPYVNRVINAAEKQESARLAEVA